MKKKGKPDPNVALAEELTVPRSVRLCVEDYVRATSHTIDAAVLYQVTVGYWCLNFEVIKGMDKDYGASTWELSTSLTLTGTTPGVKVVFACLHLL